MPREASLTMCGRVISSDIQPCRTSVAAQKALDIHLEKSIIIFTDHRTGFPIRYGRKRCQAPDSPTAGDVEPTPERCARRTLPPGRVLRCSRPGAGQVRDAAPRSDRGQVRDECGRELRFFATLFLSSIIGIRTRWSCWPGATEAGSETGAQAHRGSHHIHQRNATEGTVDSTGGFGDADRG